MAQTINSLEARLELEAIGIEEALEQQVSDYFSDWEVEDYKEPEEGRIVYC